LIEDRLDGFVRPRLDRLAYPLLAELFPFDIQGLDDAVAEQDDGVARCELPLGLVVDSVGEGADKKLVVETQSLLRSLVGTLLVIGLVAGTLGGIWFGAFTPTEGAGVGAAAALLLAIGKGLRAKEVGEVVLSVGRTSAPLLLLLVTAQLYSRVLTMTGFTRAVQEMLLSTGLGQGGILLLMVLVWFVLGCLIDSISIMLLTVPIFYPIAIAIGLDPLAFAIIGILAVETGLLTPPFGLLVFTVKAAVQDSRIGVGTIFAGAMPYWFALLAVIACLWVFPQVATYLPDLLRAKTT